MRGAYLFGDELSAADCYLFVMLRWADKFGIAVPDVLLRLQRLMEERPSVRAAIEQEESFVLRNRPLLAPAREVTVASTPMLRLARGLR
jgi:hypothetical protein